MLHNNQIACTNNGLNPASNPNADPFGTIEAPFHMGTFGVNNFISELIDLFYTISAIVLLFMLLLAGFEWMTSGGDKEKLSKARARIINAIIGMVIIALAFFVTNQLILPILGIGKLSPDASKPSTTTTKSDTGTGSDGSSEQGSDTGGQ